MSPNQKNITPFYHFFVHFGFDYTLEEIAEKVGLTKKTIHNRYISRQNLENEVLKYYQDLFISRFETKIEFSNHVIESLLLLIFDLETSIIHEFPLFYRTNSIHNHFLKFETHFLIPTIVQIVLKGQQSGDIFGDIDPKKYAQLFIYHIITVYLNEVITEISELQNGSEKEKKSIINRSIQTEYIEFILMSIITEQGKQKLKQVDLNLLFMVS
jgi:AcrR family transcriptional regulator